MERDAGWKILLWDAPVRVVHWCFPLLIPALWWTWKTDRMAVHEALGYALLALLLFRLFWGFAGGGAARFASFVRGPRAILGYLKGAKAAPGHNPLGGWSVVALLALMSAEVALGLFTQDVDGLESGPLTPLVSYDRAEAARHWHGLVFDALFVLIGVHLAAVAFYALVKRDNLIAPMITGRKAVEEGTAVPARAPLWRAVLGAAVAALLAWWVSRGCPLWK